MIGAPSAVMDEFMGGRRRRIWAMRKVAVTYSLQRLKLTNPSHSGPTLDNVMRR